MPHDLDAGIEIFVNKNATGCCFRYPIFLHLLFNICFYKSTYY